MKYDPRTPVAVFLGPSLDLETAVSILPANYYPPVLLGDVYRLIATGIETIVIIDGVFHASTPVWQRELLAAIYAGITVIGSTSMGALRAAELHHYGMIGLGKIFSWYRDGVIEGDDEVALQHLDAHFDYRSVSEPLVNIRYNLQRACERGFIERRQSDEIIAYLKKRYFGDRSYEALFKSPPFLNLLPSTQDCLREFLKKEAENLKHKDAMDTLKFVATMKMPYASSLGNIREARKSPHAVFGVLMRGSLTQKDELVPLQKILECAVTDQEAVLQTLHQAARRFYLGQWIEMRDLEPPTSFTRQYYESWCKRYIASGKEKWLRANGLTLHELRDELYERARTDWLLEQSPDSFGLNFDSSRAFAEALSAERVAVTGDRNDRHNILREGMENCFICDWARRCGIACSKEVVDDFLQGWLQEQAIEDLNDWLRERNIREAVFSRFFSDHALAHWLVEKSPAYFGFDTWFIDILILRELQVAGQVASLSETYKVATNS